MAKKIGLTDGELKAVKSTWAIVMTTNIAQTSAGLLLTWWEKHPEVLAVFPRFHNKTIDELKTMPRVRSHGSHVFTAIDAIVRNLEDEGITDQLLLDCRRDHLKFREKVSLEDYNNFVSATAAYLANALGEAFTAEAGSGWTKVLAALGSAGGIHKQQE